MTYVLGVDVGTTFTAAAIWRDGRAETVALGNRSHAVPSVVFLDSDGKLLVGEPAARRAVTEPKRIAREFKRRIGDRVPVVLAQQQFAPQQLLGEVLRWVVEHVSELEGGPPARVVVTCPANWGEYRRELLTEAAEAVGLHEVQLLEEPVAAAIHYASRERIDDGGLVGVYDLGGGTFDATILRRTADGFEVYGQPAGDDRLGGIDFDEVVMTHVATTLGQHWGALDLSDAATLQAVTQVRANAVEAKEALSAEVDAGIGVVIPGTTTEVRITRKEFEQAIWGPLVRTVETFQRTIEGAGVEKSQLQHVLLVGGSSRIPLVSQLLSQQLKVPIAVDAHPKYTVCLGAATAAGTQLDRAVTDVEQDRPATDGQDTDTDRLEHLRNLSAGTGTGLEPETVEPDLDETQAWAAEDEETEPLSEVPDEDTDRDPDTTERLERPPRVMPSPSRIMRGPYPARTRLLAGGLVAIVALVAVAGAVFAASRRSSGTDDDNRAALIDASPTPSTPATPASPTPTQPEETEEPLASHIDGTLQLGSLFPDTGPWAFSAPQQRRAVELAIQQINDAGGVLGAAVPDAIDSDEGGSRDSAQQAVDQLLAGGVDAIIGTTSSNRSLDVNDQVTDANIVQCSSAATSPLLTTRDDAGLHFRPHASRELQNLVLADEVVGDGASDVAVITRGDDFGRGMLDTMAAALEQAGANVVARETYRPSAPGDPEPIDAVADADPDAIVLVLRESRRLSFDENVELVAALVERGLHPPEVALYGQAELRFHELAGEASPSDPGVLAGLKGTTFQKNIEESFTSQLAAFAPELSEDTFASFAFDCVMLIALAAEQAQTDDPAVFKDAIVAASRDGTSCASFADCKALIEQGEDIDYEGASGPLDLTDAGDPDSSTIVVWEVDAAGTPRKIREVPASMPDAG